MAGLAKRTYSQFAEDILIGSYLGTYKNVTYIDIGCLWPVKVSNTYRFYANGGRGLCIDANPTIAELYKAERPEDIFVNSGVSLTAGSMKYAMFENPVFNTFDPKRRDKLLKEDRPGRHLVQEIEVPVRPLSAILDQVGWWDRFQKLDVLCLDVEGLEHDVLRSAPLERLKPTLIVCEVLGPIDRLSGNAVVQYLDQKGYRLVGATGHDCFFKTKQRAR
jgi:FkbM family methyltransferase